MAYKCGNCEELFDGDADYVVITDCRFQHRSPHSVDVYEKEAEAWCESCADDNSFYCEFTDERFTDSNFGSVESVDYGTVCLEAIEAAGWIWDEDEEAYRRPTDEEQAAMPDKKYVDFYWKLEDGQRRGVLQVEDGDEVAMASSLEQKIYKRIEEAGADKGDPHVVNVYTRLQLIDDKLLPEDYTL